MAAPPPDQAPGQASETGQAPAADPAVAVQAPAAPLAAVPDGGHSWKVAFGAASNIFFCSLLWRAMPVMYHPVGDAFDSSAKSNVAWINALIYALTYGLVPVVSGTSRRMSLKMLSIVGAVLIGLGQIVCFFLNSLMLVMVVLSVCCGLGSALSTVVDETAVHVHFSEARRRRARNLYYAAFSLSAIVCPKLMLHLVDVYGLSGALLLSGALSLNALVGSMFIARPVWMPPGPLPSIYQPTQAPVMPGPPKPESAHGSKVSAAGEESTAHSGGAGAPGMPGDPEAGGAAPQPAVAVAEQQPSASAPDSSVGRTLLVHCALTSSSVTAAAAIYDHAMDEDPRRSMGATSVLISFGVGDLVGRLAYDVLVRTASQTRKVMAVQAFLQGGVLFMMSVAKETAILTPIGFALGWLTGALDMLPLLVLQHFLAPEAVGRQFVLCRAASGLSCLLGPVLVSTFRDDVPKSYEVVFIASGALSLLAGAVWIPGIKKEMAAAGGKAAGAKEAAEKPADAAAAQASAEQAAAAAEGSVASVGKSAGPDGGAAAAGEPSAPTATPAPTAAPTAPPAPTAAPAPA